MPMDGNSAARTRAKVNKNELLRRAASRAGMPMSDMRTAFHALVDEAVAALCRGEEVSVAGFGTFGVKGHKGHPVQFGAGAGGIPDYVVVRFVPSDVLTAYIRERYGTDGGTGYTGRVPKRRITTEQQERMQAGRRRARAACADGAVS